MKILVTGTTGFIGFHLAKKFLERGDTVVGIDNINHIPSLPLTPEGELLPNPDAIGIHAQAENLARAGVGL